jgi:hypothetical protein
MKISKFFIRIWITVVTVGSFLVGWVFFAHSNKPAPLFPSQPAQTAQAFNQGSFQSRRNFNNDGFQFSNQATSNVFRPRLRTGGS